MLTVWHRLAKRDKRWSKRQYKAEPNNIFLLLDDNYIHFWSDYVPKHRYQCCVHLFIFLLILTQMLKPNYVFCRTADVVGLVWPHMAWYDWLWAEQHTTQKTKECVKSNKHCNTSKNYILISIHGLCWLLRE